MADEAETVEILKRLAAAYPGQKIEKETVVIYAEQLRDIPTRLLKMAAERYLQGSPWFPKISNLREMAASMAGTTDFKSLETPRPDAPYQDQLKLEADFYQQGRLDPEEWGRLAEGYERAGRLYAAQAVRDKLKGRAQILREKQASTEATSPQPGAHPLEGTEAEAGRLRQAVQDLEEAFFDEGRLEAGEWVKLASQFESLAQEFERLERPFRAEGTRERWRRLERVREVGGIRMGRI